MKEFSRKRTQARQIAMQYLYMRDILKGKDIEPADGFIREQTTDADVIRYAGQLVRETIAKQTEIDSLIESVAENWTIARMPAVDRNIIRLSISELMADDAIPVQVTINEAIEMGRKYSTRDSGSFINGIIDKIAIFLKKDTTGSDVAPEVSDSDSETTETEGTL